MPAPANKLVRMGAAPRLRKMYAQQLRAAGQRATAATAFVCLGLLACSPAAPSWLTAVGIGLAFTIVVCHRPDSEAP